MLDDLSQSALDYSPFVSSEINLYLSKQNYFLPALQHVLNISCNRLLSCLTSKNLSDLSLKKEQQLALDQLIPLSLTTEGDASSNYIWPRMNSGAEHAFIDQARTVISMQKREEIVNALEEALKSKFQAKYAVTFPTGTLALYASFIAADIRPGDEVIVPSYGRQENWGILLSMGAILVPVDLYDENDMHRIDGCMDPEKIVNEITNQTKAIVITHMWGLVCDAEKLEVRVKEEHEKQHVFNTIVIIEVASYAHFGKSATGKYAGSLTKKGIGAFSFNEPDHLSVSEGGFVLTNDDSLFHRLLFSMHGNEQCKLEVPSKSFVSKFCSAGWATKARMHPFVAAIALHQLQHVAPELIERRAEVARHMETKFAKLKSVSIPRFHLADDNQTKSATAFLSRYAIVLQYRPEAFDHRVSRVEFVKEIRRQASLDEGPDVKEVEVPSVIPIVDHELYMSPNSFFPQFNDEEIRKRRLEILLRSGFVSTTSELPFSLSSDYPESRKFFQSAIRLPVWDFKMTSDWEKVDIAEEKTMLRYIRAFRNAEKELLKKYDIGSEQMDASSQQCGKEFCQSSAGNSFNTSSRPDSGDETYKKDKDGLLRELMEELCKTSTDSEARHREDIINILCSFFMSEGIQKILVNVVISIREELNDLKKDVEVIDKKILSENRDISQDDQENYYLPLFQKTKRLMMTNFSEYDSLFEKKIFNGHYSFSELLNNDRVPFLKSLKVALKAEAFASALIVDRGNAFSAMNVFLGKGVILQMHNFDNPELEDDPHCHKKHFFSGLLFGEYVHRVWTLKEVENKNMGGVTLFECSKVDSQNETNPCRALPGKQLEVLMEHRHTADQVMYINSKTVHTVDAVSGVGPISVVLRSGKASSDTVYYQYFEDDKPGQPVSGPGGLVKLEKMENVDKNKKEEPRVEAFSKRKILSNREAVQVAKGFFEKLEGITLPRA